MASRNRRRDGRRAIRIGARIQFAGAEHPIGCEVVDISESGARVNVAAPTKLPAFFSLIVDGKGQISRLCRVAWRAGTNYGVAFAKRQGRVLRPSRIAN